MAASTHTFLFADLVGFTALAELEGDDRALEVALALQRRVRDMLEEQLDDAGAAHSSEAGGRAGRRPEAPVGSAPLSHCTRKRPRL